MTQCFFPPRTSKITQTPLNSDALNTWNLCPPFFLISMSKSLAHRTVWEAAWGLVFEGAFSWVLFWTGFKRRGSHCMVKMIERNRYHVHSAFDDHCSLTIWALFWLDVFYDTWERSISTGFQSRTIVTGCPLI